MSRNAEDALVEVVDGSIVPEGHVTVEIKDERGKTIDKEDHAHNFIAKTWKAHARALLRTRWMGLDYNRLFTGQTAIGTANSNWPSLKATVPLFLADGVGCWNQTTAEDSTNEHTPVIPATGIVAWASRWPFGSATGSRGTVDQTDSFTDDDTVRHVFNWASSQGNGTFQSVGWLPFGAVGIPSVGAGVAHRSRSTLTVTPSAHLTGATSVSLGKPYVHTDGTVYHFLRRQSSSSLARVVSHPASTELDDSTVGILGTRADVARTLTNVSGEFTPTSFFGTDNNVHGVLGRDGTNTVFWYNTSNANSSTHRWGFVADGATTSTTYNWPDIGWPTGCVIGSHVYGAVTGGSSIYKLLISTGATVSTIAIDASVTALCTLAGITTPRVLDMTTDGTSLYVLYTNSTAATTSSRLLLVRLNDTGVLQQVYGCVPHSHTSSQPSETASAPYAGTYVFRNSYWQGVSDYGAVTVDSINGGNSVEDILTSGTTISGESNLYFGVDIYNAKGALSLHYYDGSIILGFQGSVVNTASWTQSWYRQGFDLGSRVLLSTSKVKSVGQTMKITYDITLPGWF